MGELLNTDGITVGDMSEQRSGHGLRTTLAPAPHKLKGSGGSIG